MTAETERMSPTSAAVVAVIRQMRQEQGLSARALAEKVTDLGFPISREMVSNWETDRKNFVPIDYLITGAQALGSDAATVLVKAALLQCPTCQGQPPVGFTCNTCGGTA